jgi:large subunit ribosomal protein L30e
MIDVNKAIATSVKTGKVLFGINNAVRSAKQGRAKLILLASNCPHDMVDDVTHYAKFSDVPVVIYKGSSNDLGITCGKPFMVSALAIREPGDSDIVKLTAKNAVHAESIEESEIEAAEDNNA